MTMAHSIEARGPFLDYRVAEFSFAIPSELKLRGLTTKYILKKAAADLLPYRIIKRKIMK
jgi:asparagine synthase (glutamine-hydrolysing)